MNRPEFDVSGRRCIFGEAWGEATERGYPYKPYHYNVYEDVAGSDACTAFISDPEGVRAAHFENPADAKAYYHELIGQADWAQAVRGCREGIKNDRVAWDDIIE